jgi:hypothetical protein
VLSFKDEMKINEIAEMEVAIEMERLKLLDSAIKASFKLKISPLKYMGMRWNINKHYSAQKKKLKREKVRVFSEIERREGVEIEF